MVFELLQLVSLLERKINYVFWTKLFLNKHTNVHLLLNRTQHRSTETCTSNAFIWKISINMCKTIFHITTNYGKQNFNCFKNKFISYNWVQKKPLQAYICLKISTTIQCTKSINKPLARINFCMHNIKTPINIKQLKKFKSMRKH